MSYIAFVTQDHGGALLRGTERAYMRQLVRGLSESTISLYGEERVMRAIKPSLRSMFGSPGLGRARLDTHMLAIYLDQENELFQLGGESLSNFPLLLNTALVLGSDPICLAARLHGQSELHAYVEGPNRVWLADVIQQGLDSKIFRPDVHWDEVQALLRASDAEPVVTYYSGMETFPNPGAAEWTPKGGPGEGDWDEWFGKVSDEEKWRLSIAGLRSHPERELELRPDRLRSPFTHEKSLFDVFGGPR